MRALGCSCVGVRSLRGFVHREGKCAGHPGVLSLWFSPPSFQTWNVPEVGGGVCVKPLADGQILKSVGCFV